MTSPTSTSSWEEEFDKKFPQQNVEHWIRGKRMDTYHVISTRKELTDFIHILLSQAETAARHEQSMTDISFAFDAGVKEERARIVGIAEEWHSEMKSVRFNHGYSVLRSFEDLMTMMMNMQSTKDVLNSRARSATNAAI